MTRRSRSTFNLAPNNRKKSYGRATHASYSLVDGDHRGDVVFSARRPLAAALKCILRKVYSPRPFPPPFSRRLRGVNSSGNSTLRSTTTRGSRIVNDGAFHRIVLRFRQ